MVLKYEFTINGTCVIGLTDYPSHRNVIRDGMPFLPLHSNVKSQNKYKKKRRLKTKQYGNVVCDALLSRIVGAYIYVVVVRSDRQPYF